MGSPSSRDTSSTSNSSTALPGTPRAAGVGSREGEGPASQPAQHTPGPPASAAHGGCWRVGQGTFTEPPYRTTQKAPLTPPTSQQGPRRAGQRGGEFRPVSTPHLRSLRVPGAGGPRAAASLPRTCPAGPCPGLRSLCGPPESPPEGPRSHG